MRCTVVTIVTVLLGVSWVSGQFLNNRPYPKYSLEHMPDTSFTCQNKVAGGYYADAEAQCQMFHVCINVAGSVVQDFRFLCPNGTAFDQDHQICAEWDDVDCEAATLYYSSDNFDLYRLGSGFETAPFPGEDEATYHLQRSETGDTRISRERENVRVNQQTNYNTVIPPKRPQFNKERDILRGSSSSNFFNNKNGGKENDDDYEERSPNSNAEIPRRKIIRKLNRKPEEVPAASEAPSVPKPNRPTAFSNNFAGSSYAPSTTGRSISTTTSLSNDQFTTAVNNYRGRQRSRGNDRQYNNAESFRNNNNNNNDNKNTNRNNENIQYNRRNNGNTQYSSRSNENTQYNNRDQFKNSSPSTTAPFRQQSNEGFNRNQPTKVEQPSSTPAPFRQPDNRQYSNVNRQTTQYDNNQHISTTVTPKQQYSNQYDTTKIRPTQQDTQTTVVNNRQTFNQYKQTENYPSSAAPFRTQEFDKQTSQLNKKETENYPTASPFANKQTFNGQYEAQKTSPVQTQRQTDNYPTTISFTNKQTYNTQYDAQKKPTTQFKQTDNYSTTFEPTKQNYQSKQTQFYQKQTENYPTTVPATKQTSQYTENQYTNNNRQTTFNQQYTQTSDYKQQYDSTRFSDTQYNSNAQTTQFNQQYSTTNRPTTVHTQYTPTVPKQTNQFAQSTTTPATRFSKQYDETNYDDGAYNPKFDDEKYKPDDEFLKTAHSQNIASSRNELASSSKVNIPIPTSQPARPFAATTSAPKLTNPIRETPAVPKTTTYEKPSAPKPIETKSQTPAKPKSDKDVSYDYAYYDTNVGSEPDYDVGTEFARSTKKSN